MAPGHREWNFTGFVSNGVALKIAGSTVMRVIISLNCCWGFFYMARNTIKKIL
jgi:hypothetical protein